MQFNEMNLIAPLLKAVEEVGYTTPTPIQQQTIMHVLNGRDVLGCAQTGTGKTAAFSLPILQILAGESVGKSGSPRPIRSLILAPTRELAMQNYENIVRYAKGLSLRAAVIFGGVNQASQVHALQDGVDIVVATPGRLTDLMNQGFVKLNQVEIFVLDEADRMLDMGFARDVRKVMACLPQKRQTLLFSATMPKEVEKLALDLLTDPVEVKVTPVSSTVDTIVQQVYFVNKGDKSKSLLYLLKETGVNTALVFTRTKHGADQVTRTLMKNGIDSMAIHGNKSQNARQTALKKFESGKISVLVATDIAARGIDISGLPFVVNYNVPEEAESYIHRIGRTGRAGQPGTAITLCCGEELNNWHAIERLIRKTVPVQSCDWSVADMKPVASPPRGGNQNAGNRKKPPENTSRNHSGQHGKSNLRQNSGKQEQHSFSDASGRKPSGQKNGFHSGQNSRPARQGSAQNRKPSGQSGRTRAGFRRQG